MFKFYVGLFREIPAFFRGTVEAYLFWIAGGIAMVGTIWPQAMARVPKAMNLPHWFGPIALLGVVLYGLLRVSYDHQRQQAARIEELSAFPSKTYLLLCHFSEKFAELEAIPLHSDAARNRFRNETREAWASFESQVLPRLQYHQQAALRDLFNPVLRVEPDIATASGVISGTGEAQSALWQFNQELLRLVTFYSGDAPRFPMTGSVASMLARTDEK